MHSAMALALLTSCLALSACGDTVRSVSALRPDVTNPERFICDPAGTRPVAPPEFKIDWATIVTVAQARAAHEGFVATLRTREGVVAGYIVKLEARHFICFNNMQWQREFYAGLPAE